MAGGAAGSQSGDVNGDRQRVERAIRALRAGKDVDENFNFLFRRFSQPLQRQFVRWGALADEARDLNQETFQRIFQDVGNFQGEDHLFESWVGWIWRIARTSWLKSQRFKRASKRPQNPQALEVLDEVGEPAVVRPASQLEQVLTGEIEQQVRDAIGDLPEQEGKCVILHYYQGLKIREIAVILKIAQGTVKAHMSHARAKLKGRLEDWLELEGPTNDLRGE